MPVRIEAAVLRDASWVVANMRDLDRQECYAQLDERVTTARLAEWMLMGGRSYVAYLGDDPVMFFGTTPMTINCFSVWAVGTDRIGRAIPEASRLLLDHEVPRRIAEGFTCAEARAIATHGKAHRWIESLGGVKHGPAFEYGKAGEFFVLYRWTVAGYRAICETGRWNRTA